MVIILLILITFIILLWNFVISDYDFLNPSVLFCGMNLIYAVTSLVIVNTYGMEFHIETAAVLISGLLVFTLFNIVAALNVTRRFPGKIYIGAYKGGAMPLRYYRIRTIWIVLFILFEAVVALFMIKYARDVSRTFYGPSGGLARILGNYNKLIKTKGKEISAAGLHPSIIYTLGWPLCIAFNTLLSAVAIINFKITKKLPFRLILPYVIMVGISFLNASRSTAFRFMTQLVIEYIIIHRWYQGSVHKGNFKLFVRMLFFGGIAIVALANSINLIGRSTSIPLFEYVTAYVGGPFVNLDIGIPRDIHRSVIFGQETFHHFYALIAGRLHMPKLIYNLYIPYNYVNGHFLGNVYTMYYMFIEDFGYAGIIPLTSIIAAYYNLTYAKLNRVRRHGSCLTLRLLIFGYLFNDLLMLTFSNRFYETSLGKQAILFYFFTSVVWFLFKKGFFTESVNRYGKAQKAQSFEIAGGMVLSTDMGKRYNPGKKSRTNIGFS